MPANEGSWSAANALSVMVTDGLIEFAERQSRIFPLFRRINSASTPGITVGIRRWPNFSDDITDLTEATGTSTAGILLPNIAPDNSVATTVQITPTVTGMGIEITDLLDSATDFETASAFERQFRGVVVEEVDDDLAALFTAFNSGTQVGTNGVDATLSDFLDGMVILQTNQADGPMFSVMHPRQAADLGLDVGGFGTQVTVTENQGVGVDIDGVTRASGNVVGTNTGGLIDRLNSANGMVGSIAGVPVVTSARVLSAAGDRQGCIAVPDAATTVYKWLARGEVERNAMGVSFFQVVSSAYAVGATADNFGVPFETDA